MNYKHRRFPKFKSHSIWESKKDKYYRISDRPDDMGHVMLSVSKEGLKRKFNNTGKLINVKMRLKDKVY